ncbi:MAG TPA: 16S rRNA (uracil(1498)-N(3))-methyltransferase [Mycobacteriales bacterium]|nr:16S rRNA (uracil(1498)-N(3))-methyltransferase [Mycobacteriales bacterium]
MSNPVYLAAALDSDVVVLDGPEGRHAATVRRTRVGEVVDLVDGLGTRCTGTVTAVAKDSVTVAVEQRVSEPVPSPRLVLVQALAKGERGELAVELATEVGVDEVVPWRASRSIAQWEGERGEKALARWRATAREAAKQSRRAWFPEVRGPVTTAQIPSIPGRLLVLHESAPTSLSQLALDPVDLVLVVGPEGGVSDDELQELLEAGGTAVRLGESVLRTSTAGAVAIAVVSVRTGRW